MNLLSRLLHRRSEPVRSIVPEVTPLERYLAGDRKGTLIRKKASIRNFQHRCGFEPLEERQMLSADGMTVTLATVYLEVGQESYGDMFSICWAGDAQVEDSTRLDKITINLGKEGYFDTTGDPPGVGDSGPGYNGYLPFTLVTEDTYGTGQVSTISLNDFTFYFDGDPNNKTGNGASSLTIEFNGGLKQGEKLVFLVDVDHIEEPVDTTYFEDRDVITSGGNITAWFTSEHYIMNEAEYDLNNENSDARYYQKEYDLGGIDLLSNKGVELGVQEGLRVTNEGNNTAAVVTDFQLDVKPKISGYVYADVLKNCYFDTVMQPEVGMYDYGIGNVLVTLEQYDSQSGTYKAVSSMYTDSNGFYEFDGLDAGQYRITSAGKIPYTEGGVQYTYTDSCARSDHNPVSGDPLVLTTDVTVGTDSIYNNFGKVLRGSIEGNVYEDWNDNGLIDRPKAGDEPGIAGVKVQLFYLNGQGEYVAYHKDDGNIYTTTTDANGQYRFDDLKVYDTENKTLYMTYAVKEYQPEDYVDGKDAVGTIDGAEVGKLESNDYITEITLGWNKHGVEYNFGELKLGSIEGNVYEDRNDNGIKEAGEPGIGAVKIELLRWNGTEYEVIDSQLTDAEGHYCFDNLDINQEYAIRETQPEEYADGKEHLGTFDGQPRGVMGQDEFTKITVGWNEHGVDYDFGELLLGSIAGHVFEDHNDNGKYEPQKGEQPIEGVQVTLYERVNGEYVVSKDADGNVRTMLTDADGAYLFDNLSIEKVYAVRETQPAEYSDGKEELGTINGVTRGKIGSDEFYEIDIHWDEHGVNYNFGELLLGSVSGHVFEDRNDNGKYEPEAGELPISGVKITLFMKVNGSYQAVKDASGNIRTATTDENGYYEFDNLDIEKVYAIRETQPSDYSDGKEELGMFDGIERGKIGQDEFTEIDVHWNEHGVNYNFGELKLGSVAGYVFEDHNDNGKYEPHLEDQPIEGVLVSLYYKVGDSYVAVLDASGNIRTATTDVNGYYEFDNLDIEKVYAIRETQPVEYTDGQDELGTFNGVERGIIGDDEFYEIDVHWDEHGINYNFGELLLGSLSGHIYYDANNDGIFNKADGDYGLVGEKMTLGILDAETGEYVDIAVAYTVEDGYYIFTDLAINETYCLTETQPAGYLDGKDTVGTINGITVGTLAGNDYMNDILVKWDNHGINYNFGEILEKPNDDPPKYQPVPETPDLYIPSHYYSAQLPAMSYIPSNVATAPVTVTRFGGGAPVNYAWHLSVLNGGYPRSIEAAGSVAGFRAMYGGNEFVQVAWSGETATRGEWLLRGANGEISARYVFGTDNAVPVTGDWDGDGTDNIGVYTAGKWLLDWNGDGKWDDEDLYVELGNGKDQPVTGDWDGDGKSDIGIFGPRWSGDSLAISLEPGLPADQNSNTFQNVSRPKNVPPEYSESNTTVRIMKHRSASEVRVDLIDHVFEYGQDGDKAVTGDWNGDGIDKIGVYRNGTWYLDVNGNGVFDDGDVTIEGFGNDNSIPVVGDWDGDGIDNVGIFEDGLWALDSNGDYKPDTYFTFGQAGDKPVTGDFNGDGTTELGVYRESAGEITTSTEEDSLSM